MPGKESAALTYMREQNFDRQLKQVLDNLETPYEPGTWALLERRLDALIIEEQPAPVDVVDKAVYHTLERLEVPFQPGHWDLLAQRMQQQALRIRRIRLAKVAEAAILLFFLSNLHWFPGSEQLPGRRNAPLPPKPDVPVASATPYAPKSRLKMEAAASPGLANVEGVDALPSAPAAHNLIDLLDPAYRQAQNVGELINALQAAADKANHPVAALEPVDPILPFAALVDLDIPTRQTALRNVPVRRFQDKKPAYVATFASADQHFVLINGSRRPAAGYGAGVALGTRKGKWGVETGLLYSHNAYEPHKKVEIYKGNLPSGYYGSTLTNAQMEMLSVPVKASRELARMGKTTARAVAGATAHFAVQKTYDYGTLYFNDPPPSNQSAGNPKLRQSGRGVLEEGGKLAGNVYASVDAGIRLERPLGNGRYTAFIEPVYRQSLTRKGVGPNREPVNTLSLQAGVMAFL